MPHRQSPGMQLCVLNMYDKGRIANKFKSIILHSASGGVSLFAGSPFCGPAWVLSSVASSGAEGGGALISAVISG